MILPHSVKGLCPQKEIKKEPFYKWSYGKFKPVGYIQDGQTTDTKTKAIRDRNKPSESSHI